MVYDWQLIGAEWGDEGKGRGVQNIVRNQNIKHVAKYQGGANSGHTQYIKEDIKIALHMLPDGVTETGTFNYLTQGVALDLVQTFKEIDELKGHKISLDGRLFISHRATVVMAGDVVSDFLSDGNGSTAKGIRYCYGRQSRPRLNIRVEDLYGKVGNDGKLSEPRISQHLERFLRTYEGDLAQRLELEIERLKELRSSSDEKTKIERRLERGIKLREELRSENEATRLLRQADRLLPYVADTTKMLEDVVNGDREGILYDGSQAALLDKDSGPGDDLTSSSSSGAALFANLGFSYNNRQMGRLIRIGVVKHLPTRVGRAGHGFPTRDEKLETALREKGDERGATTGRPREMGHPDAVAVAYAVRISGIDGLFYTKADLVDGQGEQKIAIAYKDDDTGVVYPRMITHREIFDSTRLKPIFETHSGWDKLQGARKEEDTPESFKRFLGRYTDIISEKVNRYVPIVAISTSPKSEDFIDLLDRLQLQER
ncbi:MAG: adenylosuccinate synthetase [Nanoarchaeota archaeon]